MKTPAQIETQIRALLKSELEQRLERQVLPQHCRHNHRQPLDHRRSVYGESNSNYNRISLGVVDGVALPVVQTIGLCMLNMDKPGEWLGNVCEDPLDAQRCPSFVHRQSELDIYESFLKDLKSPGWVDAHLPAVGALLWAVDAALQPIPGRMPWWDRLWCWLIAGPLRDFPRSTAEISVYLPGPPNDPAQDNGARTPASDGTSPAAL